MTDGSRTSNAEFQIDDWNEATYDEPADGPKLTRITIRKTYRGELDGAGYVASERVIGTLDGRQGSFVIQHGGLADGADQSTFGTIVPHSGTGELAGISGRATEASQGILTLVYSIP
jgi:hypothetical protein